MEKNPLGIEKNPLGFELIDPILKKLQKSPLEWELTVPNDDGKNPDSEGKAFLFTDKLPNIKIQMDSNLVMGEMEAELQIKPLSNFPSYVETFPFNNNQCGRLRNIASKLPEIGKKREANRIEIKEFYKALVQKINQL